MLQIRIASPCTEKWESMAGDERSRHCDRCRLNVFNIKELTEVEVRALFLKAEGRVCGRIFRRRDGTVLTKDCPTGLAAVRRKALIAATMLVSIVLALASFRGRSCRTPSSLGGESWFDRVAFSVGRLINEFSPFEETSGALAGDTYVPKRTGASQGKLEKKTPVWDTSGY